MKPIYLSAVMVVSLLLVTPSCKEILMMRFGIRQPGEETPESIQSFMDKMGYLSENVFLFNDSSAFYSFLRDSVFRSNMPGTLFFSPDGLISRYNDTTRCQWSGGYFVTRLQADTVYQADTGYTFREFMASVKPLNQSVCIDTANADYLVVVTWARFLGNYNDRLFSIRKALDENPDVVVKPIFLCIDIQKDWGMAKKELESFHFE